MFPQLAWVQGLDSMCCFFGGLFFVLGGIAESNMIPPGGGQSSLQGKVRSYGL
jgi:hypothetical protein